MKGSRFSEEQIIGILREQEAGAKVPDLCPSRYRRPSQATQRRREAHAAMHDGGVASLRSVLISGRRKPATLIVGYDGEAAGSWLDFLRRKFLEGRFFDFACGESDLFSQAQSPSFGVKG